MVTDDRKTEDSSSAEPHGPTSGGLEDTLGKKANLVTERARLRNGRAHLRGASGWKDSRATRQRGNEPGTGNAVRSTALAGKPGRWRGPQLPSCRARKGHLPSAELSHSETKGAVGPTSSKSEPGEPERGSSIVRPGAEVLVW